MTFQKGHTMGFKPGNPLASAGGKIGGKSTSKAKKESSRKNGQLGGRPKKKQEGETQITERN